MKRNIFNLGVIFVCSVIHSSYAFTASFKVMIETTERGRARTVWRAKERAIEWASHNALSALEKACGEMILTDIRLKWSDCQPHEKFYSNSRHQRFVKACRVSYEGWCEPKITE